MKRWKSWMVFPILQVFLFHVVVAIWPTAAFLLVPPTALQDPRHCRYYYDHRSTEAAAIFQAQSTAVSQSSDTRSASTGRPETPLERRLREFWDTAQPFSSATEIMDTVLLQSTPTNTSATATPLMDIVYSHNNSDTTTPSIFHHFYQGQLPPIPTTTTTQDHASDKQSSAPPPPPPRHKTNTFRLDLAYRGPAFTGWQSQGRKIIGNEQAAESSIHRLNSNAQPNQNHTLLRSDPSSFKPLYAVQDVVQAALDGRDVRVSGRTDAGVHGFGQVARVRMPANVTAERVHDQLNRYAILTKGGGTVKNGSNPTTTTSSHIDWKCWRVTKQAHNFHPTFDATKRSYIYLVDGAALAELVCSTTTTTYQQVSSSPAHTSMLETIVEECLNRLAQRVNALFKPLLDQTLDYLAVSHGKVKTENTLCTMTHLRAVVGSTIHKESPTPFLAIELTSDRFLRRQIRILVATALLLALDNTSHDKTNGGAKKYHDQVPSSDERLQELLAARDRSVSARAAPPGGLIFVGAEFG